MIEILAIVVLGVLIIGFAYAADQWHKRAEFWEQAYLEKAGNLEALLDGIERYAGGDVNEGLLRVWKQSASARAVFH